MVKGLGFLQKINTSILRPADLWEDVLEESFGKSFLYLFLLFFFSFIPDIPQALNQIIQRSSTILNGIATYFFMLFVIFFVIALVYVVYAGFFYVISYIFLNQARYIEGLKILIYSFTLPYLVVFVYNIVNTIVYVITGRAIPIDSSAGMFLSMIYFVTLVLSFLYSLYVQYTALSVSKDSVGRKIGVICVSAGIILFLVIAIALGIFILLEVLQALIAL